MIANTLEAGIIKWYGGYNAKKEQENKFGFIERISQSEDLFVHEKNLDCKAEELEEETVVFFEVRQNKRTGKNEAIKVRLPNFDLKEDLMLCAEIEHSDIWLPALSQLVEKLTVIDDETGEFLLKKFTELRTKGSYSLNELVNKLPDQAFFDCQHLTRFLPLERYLVITSELYSRSSDDVAKEQMTDEISTKLKNNRYAIPSYQNTWHEIPSLIEGEDPEWVSDDYKTDVWDSLPYELITDERIWLIVPDHKKYSILLKRLNPSTKKEEYGLIFDKVVETVKMSKNKETIPEGLKRYKRIYPHLSSVEQVKTGWPFINHYWDSMNRDAKILAAYRAAKENQNLEVSNFLETEKDLLVKAVLLLLGRKLGKSAPLEQVHHWITEYITKAAWKSTEPLDLGPILPGCSVLSNVKYCEARRWPTKEGAWKTNDKGQEIAYCPRQHGPCVVNTEKSLNGAHVNGLPEISWDKWTLTDFFESLGVNPNSNSLNRNDTYLLKISGWVNRLNEIRERMKCEQCGKTLIPDKKYGFNPAGYNSTVARCPDGHGSGVYFNHCSNKDCSHIIDSRESSKKYDRYYICILCGDIPRYSRVSFIEENPFHHAPPFTPGDICPKCGKEKMLDLTDNEDVRVCSDSNCNHRIYLKGRKTKKRPTNRIPVTTKNYVSSLGKRLDILPWGSVPNKFELEDLPWITGPESKPDSLKPQPITEFELTNLPWLPNTENEPVVLPGPTVSKIELDTPPWFTGSESKSNSIKPQTVNDIKLEDLPWFTAPETKFDSLKPQTVAEIELDDLPWLPIAENEFLESVASSGVHYAADPSYSQSYRCDICGGVVANDVCTSCMFDWDS